MRAFDETDKMCKELIKHGEDELRCKIEAQIRKRLHATGFGLPFSWTPEGSTDAARIKLIARREVLCEILRDVLNVSVI